MKFAANENLMDPLILSNQNEEMVERFYSEVHNISLRFLLKLLYLVLPYVHKKKKKTGKKHQFKKPKKKIYLV